MYSIVAQDEKLERGNGEDENEKRDTRQRSMSRSRQNGLCISSLSLSRWGTNNFNATKKKNEIGVLDDPCHLNYLIYLWPSVLGGRGLLISGPLAFSIVGTGIANYQRDRDGVKMCWLRREKGAEQPIKT